MNGVLQPDAQGTVEHANAAADDGAGIRAERKSDARHHLGPFGVVHVARLAVDAGEGQAALRQELRNRNLGRGIPGVVRLYLRGERQRSRGIETANRTVVALGQRGLEFIPQPEIDVEPARDFPIVLDETGEVLVDLGEVGGGRHGNAAAQDAVHKRRQRLADGGRGGIAQRAHGVGSGSAEAERRARVRGRDAGAVFGIDTELATKFDLVRAHDLEERRAQAAGFGVLVQGRAIAERRVAANGDAGELALRGRERILQIGGESGAGQRERPARVIGTLCPHKAAVADADVQHRARAERIVFAERESQRSFPEEGAFRRIVVAEVVH